MEALHCEGLNTEWNHLSSTLKPPTPTPMAKATSKCTYSSGFTEIKIWWGWEDKILKADYQQFSSLCGDNPQSDSS